MKISMLKLGKVKVFGLSADKFSSKLDTIKKYYPQNTIKKRLVKLFLLFVVFFRLDRCFFILDDELTEFLNKWDKIKNFNYESLLVRWHTDQERARCYLFFMDHSGKLSAFAKVVSDRVNKELIMSEEKALELQNSRNNTFKSPTVISAFEHNNLYMLMVSGIPEGYKHFSQSANNLPEKLVPELQYQTCFTKKSNIEKLSWFKDFIKYCKNDIFLDYIIVNLSVKGGLITSCVHGDFGSENIFYDTCQRGVHNYFLIDWERYHEHGPFITDILAFWLGRNHKKILAEIDCKSLFQFFISDFVHANNYDLNDSCFALAFMVSVKFNLAEKISTGFNLGAHK